MDLKIKRLIFSLKRKNTSYSRRYRYYQDLSLDKYTTLDYYHSLITEAQSKLNIISQRKIKFNDSGFENITKKDIFRQYGKPKYYVKSKNILKTELLLYRIRIGGHKVKLELHLYNNLYSFIPIHSLVLELHLYNNHLFFYSYTFFGIGEGEKYQIVNIIEKKYLNENPFDYNNSVLIDGQQSIINIVDSVNFTINYIYYNASDMFKNVDNIIRGKTLSLEKTQKQVTDELYHKL